MNLEYWRWKLRREPHDIAGEMARNARYAYQRAVRGWSDRDCWSADHHWERVMFGMIGRLAEWRTGCPPRPDATDWETGFYTPEEWWDGIVAFILRAFALHIRAEDDLEFSQRLSRDDEAIIHEDFRAATALVAKHWGGFWD